MGERKAMLNRLFPRTLTQTPLDTFSLLIIGQGFLYPASALATCRAGWEGARGVAPLNLFADGAAGAYATSVHVETGEGLDLGINQNGNALAMSASGLSALAAYLGGTSITT